MTNLLQQTLANSDIAESLKAYEMLSIKSYRLVKFIPSFLLVLMASPLFAQDYPAAFSNDTLQAIFHFGETDEVKLAECDGEARHTCTYVWGPPSSMDATRINAGLPPAGNKLLVVFAQANGPEDFDRVRAVYSDAEELTSLGVTAVWSPVRKQLSLITTGNLVIHINVEASGAEDQKATAQLLAEHILGLR